MKSLPQLMALSALLFLSQSLLAQHDLNSHFLNESWVSSFNNPAWVPSKKIHIGLPTVYGNASALAPNMKSIINMNTDPVEVNWNLLASEFGERGALGVDLVAHPFYFAMGFGSYRIGLEYSVVHKTGINVPGDLIQFLAHGNQGAQSTSFNVAPSFNSMTYQSIAIPFAVKRDKWTFGIRPALLKGIASIQQNNAELTIATDPNTGETSVTGDFVMTASSLLTIDETTDIGILFNDNFMNGGFSFQNNTGFSFDLGVRFQPIKKLSLGASVMGLGKINWDKNILEYRASGEAVLSGFSFNGLAAGDSINVAIELENFAENLETETVEKNEFSTALAKKFYLSGQYEFMNFLSAGAVIYGEMANGYFEPAIAINGRVRAFKVLYFGLTYGMRQNKWSNLGASLMLSAGPVQFFVASDNLLTAFNPNTLNSTNGRIGLSLAFGRMGASN